MPLDLGTFMGRDWGGILLRNEAVYRNIHTTVVVQDIIHDFVFCFAVVRLGPGPLFVVGLHVVREG